MLPPLNQSILSHPGILTNTAVNRAASEYVKMILQLVLTDPRYQKDKNGTKCNILAEDLLNVMGVETERRLANDHVMLWRKGMLGAQKMVIEDAVNNANLGCPTIAALVEQPHGHLMVVLPQPAVGATADLLIAQAGASNFYGRQMAYGVQRKDCPQVELFGWP
jgi:hypothetical protein